MYIKSVISDPNNTNLFLNLNKNVPESSGPILLGMAVVISCTQNQCTHLHIRTWSALSTGSEINLLRELEQVLGGK